MRYIVAYDVSDDRMRDKIAEAIDDFGVRVQRSVFECELDPDALSALRNRLAALIGESRNTSVRMYMVCEQCASRVIQIGHHDQPGRTEEWVIV